MKKKYISTTSFLLFLISLIAFSLLFHYWDEVKETIILLFS